MKVIKEKKNTAKKTVVKKSAAKKTVATKNKVVSKKKSEQVLFSIILPTRGRKEPLIKSIKSLCDLADNPNQLEFLLGMDDDDLEHIEYVKSKIIPKFPNVSLHIFKRLGYRKLNMYVNSLAMLSKGHWLFIWNDDAIMKTQGWDTIMHGYDTNPMPLLRANALGMTQHPFSLFPIIKREWMEVVGSVSPFTHIDRFIYNVNTNLDWYDKSEWPKCPWVIDVPITIIHDRYDITGNNNDDTFKNSTQNYNEGDITDPRSDDYEPSLYIVLIATNKLIHHMNTKFGTNMPFIPLKFSVEVSHSRIQARDAHDSEYSYELKVQN